MNKYLYKIKDLEVPPWLKYWFARKSKINFDLSEILNGTSFDLTDTVNKKLHLINIFGNSNQDVIPTPENPIEVKSSGDNGSIVEKFSNSDNTQLQIYTIPCQQPMRAIGDVKDTFVKVDEVWCERHIIEKGVLGTENYRVATYWEAPDKSTADNYNTAFFGILVPHTVLNSVFLCNRFEYTGENYWSTDKEGLQLTTTDNRFRMRIAKNKLDGYNNDLTNAQKCMLLSDYLNNNLTEVLYIRVDPLDLPCTQAQITALENLQKARTYKDITHIYTDDEVPAELQIQYYKEKGE